MNHKPIHILMTVVLVIVGFILLRVLIRHYWLLFFVWLLMPFIRLWLTGDAMRAKLSLELHRLAKKVLIGSAIVLSIINLTNLGSVRHDVAKEVVDGYHLVKSYDCEAPDGEWGTLGPPPDECWVEDLSRVAWYGKLFLYLMEWLGVILVIGIPASTLLAGEEGLNRKEQEEQGREA